MAKRDDQGRPVEPRRAPVVAPSRVDSDSAPSAQPTEYDAFHDLASKLVKVPKKELDEARKRDKAAKG